MKRKTLIITTFFTITFCFSSCDQIRENYFEQQSQQNYTSPYKGIWLGNYAGNLNGNLKVEVFKAGNVEVTRTFDNSSETIYGTVLDNGAFQNTTAQTSGFQIFGSLQSQNNQTNGNWKQNNLSGNWQLNKQ